MSAVYNPPRPTLFTHKASLGALKRGRRSLGDVPLTIPDVTGYGQNANDWGVYAQTQSSNRLPTVLHGLYTLADASESDLTDSYGDNATADYGSGNAYTSGPDITSTSTGGPNDTSSSTSVSSGSSSLPSGSWLNTLTNDFINVANSLKTKAPTTYTANGGTAANVQLQSLLNNPMMLILGGGLLYMALKK